MTTKSVTEARDAVNSGKLLDLVVAGSSVAQAARVLDIHERTAQRLFNKAIRAYYEEHASERELVAARELRKFDLMERVMLKQALGGDQRAVDRVLAISKARRDMLGLDAAAKVSLEVSRVDEALAEVVQIIDGTFQAAEPLRRLEAG